MNETASWQQPKAKLTILLIEDEPFVRKVTELVLASAGYEVLVASTGAEALHLFSTAPEIDLVISDIVLPDADGRALTRNMALHQPALPILLITGYPAELARQDHPSKPAACLAKPFSREKLLHQVGELLSFAMCAPIMVAQGSTAPLYGAVS